MVKRIYLFLVMLLLLLLIPLNGVFASAEQHVYDDANLLSTKEIEQLKALATQYEEEHDTKFVILTTNDTKGKGFKKYTQDFYDEHFDGGNVAIITVDMKDREIYIAGFYKAKEYIDNTRIEHILDKVQPQIANENYFEAFETFLHISDEYMGIRPGVDPELFIFKWQYQVVIALGLAGFVLWIMIRNSGGKVTVNERTYMNAKDSRILKRRDVYLRKTVTKRRKPKNNGGSGGSGGGVTSGGHSHSGGSRGF